MRAIREWAPEEVEPLKAGTENLQEAYERAREKKYEAEGKPSPKPKKQRKQKEAPPVDDVGAGAVTPEAATLEQRANTLFSWMQEVREKPSEYDGVSFANLAPETVEQNLQAVADFYGAFFKHFRERFPAQS